MQKRAWYFVLMLACVGGLLFGACVEPLGSSYGRPCVEDGDCWGGLRCFDKVCGGTLTEGGKADAGERSGEPGAERKGDAQADEVSDAGEAFGDVLDGDEGLAEESAEEASEGEEVYCQPGASRSCYGGSANTRLQGECKDGVQFCSSEKRWGQCVGDVLPQVERCDGKDNDCDGQTDEGAQESGAFCLTGKQGLCANGKQSCENGTLLCVQDVNPVDEICDDGKDNDCDGSVDEGCQTRCQDGETRTCYTGPASSIGIGLCKGGNQVCQSNSWGTCVGEVLPAPERCDGLDNDCDGKVDQVFANKGKVCQVGVGACEQSGKYVCHSDGTRTECDAQAGTPQQEVCDGRDNDCDGKIDEDLGSQTCGSGVCARQAPACRNGLANPCIPKIGWASEICANGLDDDCDGKTDEDCVQCLPSVVQDTVTYAHLGYNHIRDIDWSPDGTLLASCGDDGVIHVWDLNRGLLVKTFKERDSAVFQIAWSADGKKLFAVSEDRYIRVWDVASATLSQKWLLPGSSRSYALEASRDGKWLAAGTNDNKILIWDVSTTTISSTPTKTLAGHTKMVNALAFSPDNKWLLSAGPDLKVIQWDVTSGWALKHTLTGHTQEPGRLAFAGDSRSFLSSGGDAEVRHWRTSDGKLLRTISVPSLAFGLHVSTDGKVASFLLLNGTYQRWSLETGVKQKEVVAFATKAQFWAFWVQFSADGKTIAAGSFLRGLLFWSTQTEKEQPILSSYFAGHRKMPVSVALSPDERLVATCARSDSVKLWSLEGGKLKPQRELILDTSVEFSAVAWHPDGQKLAVAGKRLKLWDVDKGTMIRDFGAVKRFHTQIAFNAQGTEITVASYDRAGTLSRWDVNTGQAVQLPSVKVGSVFALSPRGTYFANASFDSSLGFAVVDVYELATGRLVKRLTGHSRGIAKMAFGPQEKLLATASTDAVLVRSLDGSFSKTMQNSRGGAPKALAFYGVRVLALNAADRMIKFWDVDAGTSLPTLPLNDVEVGGMVFFRGGQLVVGSGQSTIFSGKYLSAKLQVWSCATCVPKSTVLFFNGGHTASVRQVMFSSDGRGVISASEDKTAKAWETNTGRVAWTYRGHNQAVLSVAIHENNALILTGAGDGEVRLWSVLAPIKTFSGHTGAVNAVAFVPGKTTFVSGSSDGSVKFWETGKTQATRTIQAGIGEIQSLAWRGDGAILAIGSKGGTIKLWDATKSAFSRTLQGHNSVVFGLAFHPDNVQLASASFDKTVRLWDSNTGTGKVFSSSSDPAYAVAFSPDRQLLAIGLGSGLIQLVQMNASGGVARLSGHANPVYSLSFSPDSEKLVSGSAINTTNRNNPPILLWDVAKGAVLQTFDSHRGLPLQATFSTDGGRLASLGNAFSDNQAFVWDLRTHQKLLHLRDSSAPVRALNLNAQRYVVGANNKLEVRLFEKQQLLQSFSVPGYPISVVLDSAGEQLAAVVSKTLYVWNIATTKGYTFPDANGYYGAPVFSPDGKLLAACTSGRICRLFVTATGGIKATLTGLSSYGAHLQFRPDGQQVALADGKEAKVWDVSSGMLKVLKGHTSNIQALAFHPSLDYLASSGADRSVRLWDLKTSTVHKTLSSGQALFYELAFRPDGELLAAGSSNKEIKLWEIPSGNLAATLGPLAGTVQRLQFHPDGRRLLSADTTGGIRVWDCP